MRTIEATARVNPDHTLTVPVPADIEPGERRVVVVIGDAVTGPAGPPPPLALPVHDVGLWPPDLSLRREDMYGDDGR